MFSNIHTHSVYSDGRCTPERMVLRAVEKGFHTLGFSEHAPWVLDDAAVPSQEMENCRREVRRLQTVYGDRIQLLFGIEHDVLGPDLPGEWDFIIESVHGFWLDEGYQVIDNSKKMLQDHCDHFFGGDPYKMCKAYFEMISQSCGTKTAQVLGHMELIMKFNEKRDMFDDSDPRYLSAAREAVQTAAESGLIVEINTGAISRGYRTEPAPGFAVMKMLHEAHAPVMLGSDCHHADGLDTGFDLSKDMLRTAGYKSVLAYRGKTIEEVSIL